MASGGRPPHSAPSLPLHTSPSAHVESLRTPDTSGLFMSTVGSSQGGRAGDITSLEDLLNFTGISHQPSPSSLSRSLEAIAQDMEQKQDTIPSPLTIGPPDSKRLCMETTPVSAPSTLYYSPLTTHSSQLSTLSSPLSLNTRDSSLPTSMANSWNLSGSVPSLGSTQVTTSIPQSSTLLLSGVPSSTTPLTPVTARIPLTTAVPTMSTVSFASPAISTNMIFPAKGVPKTSSNIAGGSQSSVTLVPSVLAQSNHILSTAVGSSTYHTLCTSSSNTLSTVCSPASQCSPSTSPHIPSFNSLPSPSPTTLPSSSISSLLASFTSSAANLRTNSSSPVPSPSPTPSSHSTPPHTLSLTSQSASTISSLISMGGLSTSHPAQRALLVQLVQAYRQCSALGDTQGQARVKAQLNLLLNAQQQKIGGTFIVPRSTSSHPLPSPTLPPAATVVNHKTTNFLSPKPKSLITSSHASPVTPSHASPVTPSHASPVTPSLLTNSSKGVDAVATRTSISVGANSLLSQSVAVGIGNLPVSTSSSTSAPDHTVTTLTPITTHSRAPPSSGPASALKAAALYNLRLRQLQLYLQSLPEEQRPHSIPELKALLQRSGGPLGNMAQPTVSGVGTSLSLSTSSPLPSTTDLVSTTQPRAAITPVPTLLATALPLRPTTQPTANTVQSAIQPTVGQCLPQLTRGLSATQFPLLATSVSTTASQPVFTPSLTSLASGSLLLSPTALARFTGSQLVPSATRPLLSTNNPQQVTTQVPLAPTENVPQVTTTATLPTTTLPSSDSSKLPQTTSLTATAVSTNDPIKPGVPTPLPPGVNPETLAVLCRMPDTDLQKLNLPAVLMTAIRVWRGQHSSSLQRGGRKVTSSLPSTSSATILQPTTSSSSLLSSGPAVQAKNPAPPPSSLHPPSRPLTRHQIRTEQTKAERDRVAAFNKVLQSSEEARIAYRFNMLRDKMTNQLMAPDSHTPFKSLHDVIARLLPYHMWSEAEPPPGAIEKADAVFESVAHVLMSRSQGLMSNYQHLIYHDAQRDSEAVMKVCLERLFQESEKERKEQESQDRQQAAQIAADLSLIAGALRDDESALTFDAEFALGDVMNSDPMLTFEPGIT